MFARLLLSLLSVWYPFQLIFTIFYYFYYFTIFLFRGFLFLLFVCFVYCGEAGTVRRTLILPRVFSFKVMALKNEKRSWKKRPQHSGFGQKTSQGQQTDIEPPGLSLSRYEDMRLWTWQFTRLAHRPDSHPLEWRGESGSHLCLPLVSDQGAVIPGSRIPHTAAQLSIDWVTSRWAHHMLWRHLSSFSILISFQATNSENTSYFGIESANMGHKDILMNQSRDNC